MTIIEQQLPHEQKNQDKKERRGIILLFVLAGATGMASLLDLVWSLSTNTSWIEPLVGIIVSAVLFVAIALVKKGEHVWGVLLTAVVILAFDIYLVTGLIGVGLPVTAAFIAVIVLVANQLLSAKQASKAAVVAVITGIIIVVVDLYWPAQRLALAPTDVNIVYAGSFVVLAASFVMAVTQFSSYSVRGKLTFVSVLLLGLTVGLVTRQVRDIAHKTLTQNLEEDMALLGQSATETAAGLLTQQAQVLTALSLDSSLRGLVHNRNEKYEDEASALAEISELNIAWAEEAERSKLAVPIVSNASSRTLATFQHTFPDHLDVLLTDKYGGLVGATYTPEQYAHRDTKWWQTAYNDGDGAVYIGQPEYDLYADNFVIPIALPIYTADTNSIVGVLRTSYAMESLLALSRELGETGKIDFLFMDQMVAPETESGEISLQLPIIGVDNVEQLQSTPYDLLTTNVDYVRHVLMFAPIVTNGEFPALDELNWGMVVQQEYAEAFDAIETLKRASMVMSIVAVVIGGAVTAYAAGLITKPIDHLTETAVSIAEGDFNQHAVVETKDEIGTLAVAFNSMTDQLRGFISSLEGRVTDRTQALATSSDVSRILSTIVSVDDLVEEVVHQMHGAFGYYHVQLFLFDKDREHLVLRNGSGDVGQKMLMAGHNLPLGKGVVGRAALDNEIIVINDVAQDDIWLYNADLPDTKAEISVPIAIGTHVLGVLDIQHDIVDSFDENTVDLLQSIASQTALALQNARTFERAERQQLTLTETLAASEQQSRNLSLLNEFSASLTVANSLEDVYRIAETHIMELMQADRVAILLLSDSGTDLEIVSSGGMVSTVAVGMSLPVAASAAGTAVTENRIIRLPDERPLIDFPDSERWNRNGIKSIVAAPLSVGITAFGVLNIGSTQTSTFDSVDIAFIFQIANLLAVTIESQRLADRARLLAGIVENHPDFIGVGTADGQALYINPSGLQMMGLPSDYDTSQMDIHDFYLPDDAATLVEIGLPTATEQGSWSREVLLQVQENTVVPVEETLGINYDADGHMSGFSITMRDITARNAAAMALRNSEQSARDFQAKLTLLHEISTDLSGLDTVEMMYEQAVAVGREKLGFDRIRLWLIDEELDLMLGTFGLAADGTVYDARHFQIPFTNSWAATIVRIREGRQVSPDSELHHEGEVVGRGWQIAVVLLDAGEPIGWLAVDNLFAQEPMRVYEPELVSLFANTLANVIVNKRTADIFARQAHELQIVTEISRSAAGLMERDEMLQFVTDAMWEKFGLYHVQIFMLHEQTRTLRLTAVSDQKNHPPVDDASPVQMDERECIISHAAHQRKALIVNNLSLESSYVAAPDLPDTRAILAVPLILGRELLGVINLHSDELNRFSETDMNVQMTLASQIAAALRNVAQYQEAQEALTDLTQLQQMLSRENWEAFMTDQSRTVQGYLFDQHTVQAIGVETGDQFMGGETAVISPLTVQGITIGGLSARNPSGDPLTEDQQELLDAAAHQVAAALDRARLLEVTELGRQSLDLQASELALLNEISEIVSAQLDLESLFSTAAPRIQAALAATSIFFALYNPAEETIEFPYYHSEDEGFVTVPPRPANEDGGFTAQVILTRKPFIFSGEGISADKYAEQGGYLGDDRATSLNSFLGVPMIVGADLIGVIGVGSNRGEGQRVYNEEDQSLLATLAGTVGVAVQNVRQFEATQQRARREQTLREISNQINTAVDPESILRIAAQEIGRALGWQTYVYLAEPDETDAFAPAENGQS